MTTPGPVTESLDDVLGGEDPVEEVAGQGGGDAGRDAPDTWRGPSARRWAAFAAIAVTVLVVDQLTKLWLVGRLPEPGDAMVVIPTWLNLVHGRNSGALFGLLPQSAPVFAVVTFGVIALIVVYHRRAGRGYLATLALALLLGGAIGNLVDRLRFGYVVDWIDMGIGQWRFYTYNVADAAITTAIILLIGMALLPRAADWGAS